MLSADFHGLSVFQQNYVRAQQTPFCAESKLLPDVDTMRDRINLIAYDSGLSGGADEGVAGLCNVALEVSEDVDHRHATC